MLLTHTGKCRFVSDDFEILNTFFEQNQIRLQEVTMKHFKSAPVLDLTNKYQISNSRKGRNSFDIAEKNAESEINVWKKLYHKAVFQAHGRNHSSVTITAAPLVRKTNKKCYSPCYIKRHKPRTIFCQPGVNSINWRKKVG